MRYEIMPALMPKTFEELEKGVSSSVGHTPSIQFDVMDGVFVPAKTWPFNDPEDIFLQAIVREHDDLPYHDDIAYELDLMVHEPVELLHVWKAMKPRSIIIHPSSCADIFETLDEFQVIRQDTALGIALPPDFSVADFAPYAPYIDIVQCMGIREIGKQGEPFDDSVMSLIQSLRKHFPHILISVDGSVNEETLPGLITAGARRFVVGSALHKGRGMPTTLHHLQSLLPEQ